MKPKRVRAPQIGRMYQILVRKDLERLIQTLSFKSLHIGEMYNSRGSYEHIASNFVYRNKFDKSLQIGYLQNIFILTDKVTLILNPTIQTFVETKPLESKKLTPPYIKFGSIQRYG